MSKKDEALKALEALESDWDGCVNSPKGEALAAIREALTEQTEQQPVSWERFMSVEKELQDMTAEFMRVANELAAIKAQQQEPVSTIRALTNQCAALIQERDELQKQVWRYEKNGVTCQTYQHKIDRTCSECNVQEDYTSPPASKPRPLTGLLSIARRHPDGQAVTVSFRTLDAAIAFERYALDVAHSTEEQP